MAALKVVQHQHHVNATIPLLFVLVLTLKLIPSNQEQDDVPRFEAELEFVQSLSNPRYLNCKIEN
jgi:hypothetical protein